MNDKKDHEQTQQPERRSALKKLLTGGGILTLGALPSQWVKPVVDAVVLPTHAQTSPEERARNGFSVSGIARAPGLLDSIIPAAHAGVASFPGGFLCIEEAGGGGFVASYDTGGIVLTAAGDYGECEPLECGRVRPLGIRVDGVNGDGSFDFELFDNDGCSDSPVVVDRTNQPCSVASKECRKEKEKEREKEFEFELEIIND